MQIKSEESFINDVSENELMIQIEYLDETSSQYMENNQDYEEQNYQYWDLFMVRNLVSG